MNPPTDAHVREPAHEPAPVEPTTVLPKNKARQGVTGHNARYVLAISFAAAVVALAAIYLFYFAA
jgi:hypothetical protein